MSVTLDKRAAYVCNNAFDKNYSSNSFYIGALRTDNWRVSGFGTPKEKANDFNEVIAKIRKRNPSVIVVNYELEPFYWRYSGRGFGKKDAFLGCRLAMGMVEELRDRGSKSVIVVPTEISLPSSYSKDYIKKGADVVLMVCDFTPWEFVDEINKLERIKARG